MQSILRILLLFFYAISIIGVNIAVHICDGDKTTFFSLSSLKDPCACGDEEMAAMCCTTEMKSVQLDDTQKTAPQISSNILYSINIFVYSIEEFTNNQIHTSIVFDDIYPPPKTDLNIKNSVFLI